MDREKSSVHNDSQPSVQSIPWPFFAEDLPFAVYIYIY